MHKHKQSFACMQPLESRRLLHAGHLHVGLGAGMGVGQGAGGGAGAVLEECPEVVEAREGLQDAVAKLNADHRAGRKTIKADRIAIVEEMKQLADDIGQQAIKDALQPLKDELHTQTRAKNKEFKAAREELRIAKRKGRQLIAADLEALKEAQQSGDQEAIDAAKAKVQATREQVQEDLKPIRDGIVALGEKWRPILTEAHEAVESKLEELNPDLAPLFDKLDDDIESIQAKLEADHAAVSTAQEELKTAIADCREEHGTDHEET